MTSHIDDFHTSVEKMRDAIVDLSIMADGFAEVGMGGPAQKIRSALDDIRAHKLSMERAYTQSLSDRVSAVEQGSNNMIMAALAVAASK